MIEVVIDAMRVHRFSSGVQRQGSLACAGFGIIAWGGWVDFVLSMLGLLGWR